MGKVMDFPRICTKCHKVLAPDEIGGHDIDDQQVCIDCFFAPLEEAREAGTVIAEIEE